jgi:hypothetical protein
MTQSISLSRDPIRLKAMIDILRMLSAAVISRFKESSTDEVVSATTRSQMKTNIGTAKVTATDQATAKDQATASDQTATTATAMVTITATQTTEVIDTTKMIVTGPEIHKKSFPTGVTTITNISCPTTSKSSSKKSRNL